MSCYTPSRSHQPLFLLLVELLGPAAGQLQVVVGPVGEVVQVHSSHGLLGRGPLYLGPFVPLVERRDADDVRPRAQRRLQGRFVIAAVHAVSGVVVVPGPDGGVDVAGADAGDKQHVVAVAERLDGFPVLVGGAKGEAVGGEVGVHAVEAGRQDVVLVALLDQQRDEQSIVGGAPQAVGAAGGQEVSPGVGRREVGVVDVEHGQALAGGGGEPVERSVVAVPFGLEMWIIRAFFDTNRQRSRYVG